MVTIFVTLGILGLVIGAVAIYRNNQKKIEADITAVKSTEQKIGTAVNDIKKI